MNLEADWEKPFLLEQKVAHIISQQAKHGTSFDRQKASWYVHVLTEKILNIDFELIPLLPEMMHKGTSYKKPFKLSGKPMAYVEKYANSVGLPIDYIDGPFSAVWWTPFDPSKSDKIKAVLLDLGWMPTEWNTKKMPFQVYTYRKKLRKMSYAAFINDCNQEDREMYTILIDGFIEAHFKNKSKNYMKAILNALGFEGRVPTFDLIKKKLLVSQFWPTSAKITEDSFDSVSEDEGQTLSLLKRRMVWSHRRSLIQGLINVEREDGKISGEANPCATPTARMKHKKIVNIPSAGSPFGEQCRSLFRGNRSSRGRGSKLIRRLTDEMIAAGTHRRMSNSNYMEEWDEKKEKWICEYHLCSVIIPDGHDAFVGGDGAGLELRMLAHYLVAVSKMKLEEAIENGVTKAIEYYERALRSAEEYKEILLHDDIHTHNQRLAGLPTRKAAKTFIYAFLYGAGNANLGAQLGGDASVGEKARETFLRECPCIPVLIDWTQEFAKANGWLPSIDGRKLIMRRDQFTGEVMAHKALNTLLQAAGSIVMKYAMCFLDGWIRKEGLRCHQVIMMHDEFQFSCDWSDVVRLRQLIDKCVRQAGVTLNMECELASDSMLGANWLHTH